MALSILPRRTGYPCCSIEHGNLLPSLSAPRQLALLDGEARLSRLNHTVDLIRERFGEGALQRASLLEAKAIST